MKLYNQLTKKIENFKPKDPSNVKIYTCGPTVYSYAHIGNLASYIYWDLLVRTLEQEPNPKSELADNSASNTTPEESIPKTWHVNRVMNITDVGHLTSDADDGEDKLEKGAKREGKTVWEIADFYITAFQKDWQSLLLKTPSKVIRATDAIPASQQLVSLLTEKGYTYETSDGIYFDTSKFPTYKNFANLDLEHLKAGARVGFSSEKRHVSDFALWKFIKPGEDHAMQWNYLGRPGYPGWHLECSAIAHLALGEPLDIHCGGIDHIPVHHTNEIAQSEAAFDVQLSRLWLHCSHIMIGNQKISKSLGNVYTLPDLKAQGFAPLDYKLWILQGHYQGTRTVNFTDLAAAKARRRGWRNRAAEALQLKESFKSSFDPATFHAFLANNLGSPDACAYIDTHSLSLADWRTVDRYFALDLIPDSPDETILEKIQARESARAVKDFATADRLRSELEQAGFSVKDTSLGAIWQLLR